MNKYGTQKDSTNVITINKGFYTRDLFNFMVFML